MFKPGLKKVAICLTVGFCLLIFAGCPLVRQYTRVPDLHGESVSSATQSLQARHLQLGSINETYSDSVPFGRVIRQDPAAGQLVRHGQTVDLVVSLGPEGSVEEQAVVDRFAKARRILADIPPDVIALESARQMDSQLKSARDNLLSDLPCQAVEDIRTYLDMTQELRMEAKTGVGNTAKQAVAQTEALYGLGRAIRLDILSLPSASRCPGIERIGNGISVGVANPNLDGLDATVTFDEPIIKPYRARNGEVYTQIITRDTSFQPGEPGAPAIPACRRLVAVPRGATVHLVGEPEIAETFKARLYPSQPEPADLTQGKDASGQPLSRDFADLPFVRDDNIYESDEDWPPEPFAIRSMGTCRGLQLAQLEVYAGQYNPVTEEVTLFEHVQCRITFEGGDDGFSDALLSGPFESNREIFTGSVINADNVLASEPIARAIEPTILGEEFMILTHPDFRTAADTLADWKNEKGISTRVFECGTGSGISGRETNSEIDDFIEQHYEKAEVQPSYILLLGDAEFIEPFTVARCNTSMGDSIGTDWVYAQLTPDGEMVVDWTPDFGLGRIPVDTAQQAEDVVNKIIAYEQTPPGEANDPFYESAAMVAQFQCCRIGDYDIGTAQRTFTEVAEFARELLVDEGYEVDRIYTETVDDGCETCDPPEAGYTDDPTPRRYYDGTMLPDDIGGTSAFAWDGDTQDIIDAWNEGRFLIMHRDHGASAGWSNPTFGTWDISSLTNGEYQPIVFSINCTSGLFDNEINEGVNGCTASGVYLCEQLLREPDSGAVGLIGDTRASPSWTNTALAKGLFDAVWPDAAPEYGDNTSQRRLGDILTHAKLYLATQISVDGAGVSSDNFYDELLLYHVYGDPTIEIWTATPHAVYLPNTAFLRSLTENEIILEYPIDNATITVLQWREDHFAPIGRGEVVDGMATINVFEPPDPRIPLTCSASLPNAVSTLVQFE